MVENQRNWCRFTYLHNAISNHLKRNPSKLCQWIPYSHMTPSCAKHFIFSVHHTLPSTSVLFGIEFGKCCVFILNYPIYKEWIIWYKLSWNFWAGFNSEEPIFKYLNRSHIIQWLRLALILLTDTVRLRFMPDIRHNFNSSHQKRPNRYLYEVTHDHKIF